MAERIRDHLPQHEEVTLVQGKVEKSLVDRVKEQMKRDKITWGMLLRASFNRYLEESKERP